MLSVKKNSKYSILPKRQTVDSVGYDLHSVEEYTLQPGECKLIDIGLSFTVPKNTYGRIAPRSSISYKYNILVNAGVIDRDYTGNVKVCLSNLSSNPFKINVGDRIAQLIIERIETPEIKEVEELETTFRGSGGFGSTGK